MCMEQGIEVSSRYVYRSKYIMILGRVCVKRIKKKNTNLTERFSVNFYFNQTLLDCTNCGKRVNIMEK